jgi:hypothetical protein
MQFAGGGAGVRLKKPSTKKAKVIVVALSPM